MRQGEHEMKTMAATGSVVHVGINNGLYTDCQPYGSMGARPKRYRVVADTHAVTCKGCLRKIAAAEVEAYTEDAERAAIITVEQGDKVTRGNVKGRVLEVCTRAGVVLAAVAFGFDLVWVKVAELVAL